MKPRATVCKICAGSGRVTMLYANRLMSAPVRCGSCLGKGYVTPADLRAKAERLENMPALSAACGGLAVAEKLRAQADEIESRGPRATS